jgi:hypothetical protein
MIRAKPVAAMLLLAFTAASGEEDFRQAITNSYAAAFSAMRQAKTKSDIEKMVGAMDAPEWVASLPAGETMTRSEAINLLGGLLAIPAEKRPIPNQQVVYMTETGWNALVLYWVYRQAENRLIGSLARDTWVRTAQGWRRIRHEKFFPDRPLMEDGKALVLPAP